MVSIWLTGQRLRDANEAPLFRADENSMNRLTHEGGQKEELNVKENDTESKQNERRKGVR